ncbi:GNAT family N-acetyltransferase [Verrucomicrobiota bacterium sgz303538]
MPTLLSPAPGHARVVERASLPALWEEAFAHVAKDQRYYELVEETLGGQFDCRYLVLEDGNGQPRAVQPFFLADQDLVTASSPVLRGLVNGLRRLSPRLLRLKLLMVGCAAGEGHLDADDEEEQHWIADATRRALPRLAREHGASMIVWKDFPARYRAGLQSLVRSTHGAGEYVRIPSMPATRLELNFADYEDYMRRHLSRVTRKSLRRKFKAATRNGAERLEMSVVNDVSDFVHELHPLYMQVFERSTLHFEHLTPEFFLQLGRRMSDRARFFVWRLDGRAVAFSVCLQHGDMLTDEYLGLDYRVALDMHLYFLTLRDIFSWAINQGLRTYFSTPLNYDPKLHLGFELAPLDLYVRATTPWIQPLIRRALPFIEPTRSEPLLQKFPNPQEL